jgi:uridylate kinase
MGKNAVDGVYDADPKTSKTAKKFASLTHRDVLEKQLGVMDATAAALAADRQTDIIVFDLSQEDALLRATRGEQVGTLVHA